MIRLAAMRAFALSFALLPVATAFGADGVKLPAYQSATLANGAQVALVEKRDTPLVSMSVTVRGGALGDQAGKEGTASLFTDLIQKGAGTRDAAQFAEAIENVGGAVAAGTLLLAGAAVDDALLAACREVRAAQGLWGITRLPDVLVARWVGAETATGQAWLTALWSLLRPVVLGREAMIPRIWNT